MDILITGRHVPVPDSFREHVDDKLSKIEPLANRDPRIDVVVSQHGKSDMTVEITCHVKGPVIRAEATAEDKTAAFDIAADKLLDRVKKANDRRRGKRRRVTTRTELDPPVDAAPLTAAPTPPAPSTADTSAPIDEAQPEVAVDDGPEVVEVADSPIEVRVKRHRSAPMSIEQALDEMELVGHDFFLFTEIESGAPSVLYRRRGWSYGVLHLEAEVPETPSEATA